RGRLLGEGLLLVVELDVGLIQQGDIEAEGEVAVRGLQKREARVPAVQIALEANGVGAELPCVEIVVRIPGRRPMRRRLEREGESQLLAPVAAPDRYRVRLRAGPYFGVVERQVEPSAPGTNRHRPRPCKGLLTEPTGGATRRVLGPAGRWGRRLAGGGASRQAKQGGDAMDGRWRDGEPGRDVRQERIEPGGVG